jgi:hypothetical protein
LGLAATRAARHLTPAIVRDLVPFLHATLAALIGLASALMWAVMSGRESQVGIMGLIGVELMLIPLAGGLLLGLFFRSAGRGQTILRAADAASIVIGLVGLSSGAGSVAWLIAVAIVALATAGLLVTFIDPAPHRGGWRSR